MHCSAFRAQAAHFYTSLLCDGGAAATGGCIHTIIHCLHVCAFPSNVEWSNPGCYNVVLTICIIMPVQLLLFSSFSSGCGTYGHHITSYMQRSTIDVDDKFCFTLDYMIMSNAFCMLLTCSRPLKRDSHAALCFSP